MRIYWYAPFNNAEELEVAAELARADDQLTVQALSTRFGKALPDLPGLDLRRNLPEPAGESGPKATILRRTSVAVTRATRREALVSGEPFDVVHIHTFNMFTDWVALDRLRTRCRTLILSVHNVRPHKRRGPEFLETWLHRRGYQACDHIIATHEVLRRQLVNEFLIPDDRTSVVPLAIQGVSDFNRAQASGGREFLFFGTLRHNKGIDVLLEAMRVLDPAVEITLRFAGRGEADLERRIEEAARNDPRIIAEVGWVDPDRQAVLYKDAWAVLLPYTAFAAQSGVLRDAYAFGVPVIASDLAALGMSVRADGTGWLVPPGDPGALASAIERAAGSCEERERFGAATAPMRAMRSHRAIGRMTRDLYDRVHPARPAR